MFQTTWEAEPRVIVILQGGWWGFSPTVTVPKAALGGPEKPYLQVMDLVQSKPMEQPPSSESWIHVL